MATVQEQVVLVIKTLRKQAQEDLTICEFLEGLTFSNPEQPSAPSEAPTSAESSEEEAPKKSK